MQTYDKEIECKWTIEKKNDELRFLSCAKLLGFSISKAHTLEITDQYLDTNSDELARKGIKLRIRTVQRKSIATFKSSSRSYHGLVKRYEKNMIPKHPSKIGAVRLALNRLNAVLGADVTLKELFRIQNHRKLFLMSTCRLKLEICFDDVKISKHRRATRLREIELELISGSENDFAKLIAQITKIGCFKLAKFSKVATAYKHFRLPRVRQTPLTPAEKKTLFG